jgi:ABC-2 type transport system ATP-binding protein
MFMTERPVIKVTSLAKEFGGTAAIDDIAFTVNEGDIYGILGPNGAGKTTTISLILALMKPTRGEIEVLGNRITAH